MSGASNPEHWLDRLAVRTTRRQALKAAIAGAALTLPLLRPTTAHADPQPCLKGCNWTAHQNVRAAFDSCAAAATSNFDELNYLIAVGIYGIGWALFDISADEARRRIDDEFVGCQDEAILQMKVDSYDCGQPGCSGFDPKKKGGPCDSCGANCCTCQAVAQGYICCAYTCDDTSHSCCPGG